MSLVVQGGYREVCGRSGRSRGNVGGRGTRRAATSTDYGGPVARRRRADDGEAEQSRRARRGREQDVAEISRRMYEEIRSSRDPRDHVEDG